jgi:hypothetical protein
VLVSAQDPLREAHEALIWIRHAALVIHADSIAERAHAVLARLDALPAPNYVVGNDRPPRSKRERIGRWLELFSNAGIPVVRRSGWFYPDSPQDRGDDA